VVLSIFDFQDLVSTSFFDGNLEIAGIVIYIGVLIAIFAITRKTVQTLVISIPATLLFSMVGVLSVDLMILLLVVTVLALAFSATKVWRD
jgi:hypothetical protein